MNQPNPPPWHVIVAQFVSRGGLPFLCQGVAEPFCSPCRVGMRYLNAANEVPA